MTDYRVGDRVRVITEGTVSDISDGDFLVEPDGGYPLWVSQRSSHIEKVSSPLPTKHGALIGHKTDPKWRPYVLFDGEWYCPGENSPSSERTVRYFMEHRGFEIIFEGLDA